MTSIADFGRALSTGLVALWGRTRAYLQGYLSGPGADTGSAGEEGGDGGTGVSAVEIAFMPLVSLNDAPAVTWFSDSAQDAIASLYFSVQQALNDVDVTALSFDLAYSTTNSDQPAKWCDKNGDDAWDYIVGVLTEHKPELVPLFLEKTGVLVHGREGARD